MRFHLANPDAAPGVTVEPWQAQFILFTSGTTGPSKDAVVSYVQMYDMMLTNTAGRLDENDVYLASTPLFHVGGSRVVNGILLLGGTVVQLRQFKTDTFWDTIRHYGATACVLLGAAARFLEDRPPRPYDADNPLRLVSMSPLVSDPGAFGRRFGVDVVTSYGMSELSVPIVSELNPANPESCGRLRPGYEARIVDADDREVPEGEGGELILRAERHRRRAEARHGPLHAASLHPLRFRAAAHAQRARAEALLRAEGVTKDCWDREASGIIIKRDS